MTVFRIAIAACIGLCSVTAFAQIPPAPTTAPAGNPPGQDQQGQTATDPNAMKTGGAAALPDVQNPPSGPDIVDDPNATPEQKASAEYSGPAVLSRAISASEPMNPQNTKFTPMLGVSYAYTSGANGLAIQNNGQLTNAGNYSGLQVNYSLTGTKVYKKDIFSLTFGGGLYNYFKSSQFNSTNNALSLTWRHILTRHLSFGVVVSGVEFDQNNLLISGAQYINSGIGTTLINANPATEAFAGQVFSYSTMGSLTYQVNARLSLSLTGGGFTTRRESDYLVGDVGYQGGADLAYRFSRQMTSGLYYSYTHYDYTGTYGATNVNTGGLAFSYAFNPRTEFIARVGISRLNTVGLVTISVDPVLAALFGTTQSLEAINTINYTPDFNVQLRRKLTNLMLSVAYAQGVTPGNGVILTSVQKNLTFGMNYIGKGAGRWNFTPTAGYNDLRGFGVTNQVYHSVFVGGNASRTIHKDLAWHTSINLYHYLFTNTALLRNTFTFTTGLAWTPRDILEHIW